MQGNIDELKENYNGNKSYGFIYANETKYFFHKSALKNCTIFQLDEGDAVEFEPEIDADGRNRANNIRKMHQVTVEGAMTNPGINPSARISKYNQDETRIIHLLSKVFYVTSGGEEFRIGDSTYRYCLVKPTEAFTNIFHISREMVVIFCDYVCFEPRSLDAVAYVYSKIKSKLRLEKGCHIFICHDDLVEDKLTRLLKDNNVTQIVIPFKYSELLHKGTKASIFEERFRKYLFDRDLFDVSTPIQDEAFFFGRRDYVHDIVSKCKSNTHCGVFGLRRSGKTSLLYAVRNLLKQQNYRTVFIPCEGDLSTLDWRMALYKTVRNVYSELGLPTADLKECEYQSANTTMYFERDMDAAISMLSKPLTIMFDEIEAITFSVFQGENSDNLWVDGKNFINFWNTVKGYYSKYPKQITVLVAGTNPMINEIPVIGMDDCPNPMFGQLSDTNQGAYLQSFSAEDMKNMVNTLGNYMGITFDEYSISRLVSDCGGHPYLSRLLCSSINKYCRTSGLTRPINVTRAIYDKALPEFEKSSKATSFFWMMLNILMKSYPKEFATLKVLALEGDNVISQVQDNNALAHLLGYGMIENNQHNFAIKYSIITNFLRGEYRFERNGLSIEEQKEEIQLRVNSAEMQLRQLVKNTLQTYYGVNAAKNKVIQSMQHNKAINQQDVMRAQGYSYSQLFDPSLNRVYFSLLLEVINDNFSCFTNIFANYSREVVEKHLRVINKARRCPDHSYTKNTERWEEKDFEKFRVSISWLEDILKDYF